MESKENKRLRKRMPSKRKRIFAIEGKKSEFMNEDSGVLQGSVVRPNPFFLNQ